MPVAQCRHGDRGASCHRVRRCPDDGRAEASRRERVLVPELPHPVEGESRACAAPHAASEVRRAHRRGGADRSARLRRATRSSAGRPSHPRADTHFATIRKIPHVDDLDVWSVWCIRVRPGHRGKGISHALLAGAVDFAREQGAPADRGLSRRQQGREGRPDDGVRRHAVALSRRPGSARPPTPTRCSAAFPRPHAARPALSAAVRRATRARPGAPARRSR